MRFLILAVALAVTASPALGQFRRELPQWAEHGNALDQYRFGLMYDLDWDVPQNDAEGVPWKPILIGAGIGLTLGFAIGAEKDNPHAIFGTPELECIAYVVDGVTDGCIPRHKTARGRSTGSLVGIGGGAAIGWLWSLGPFPLTGIL